MKNMPWQWIVEGFARFDKKRERESEKDPLLNYSVE
jgi:hypothetical protein